jgi:hypothetical protein
MIGEEKIVFGLLLIAFLVGAFAIATNVLYLTNGNKYPSYMDTNAKIVIYGGYVYPLVFGILLYVLAKAKHISSIKNNVVFMATLLGLGLLMSISAGLSDIPNIKTLPFSFTVSYAESVIGAIACLTSFVVLIYAKF